jgi:hypothetical protein
VPEGVTTTAAATEPLSVEQGARVARMPSAAAAATAVRRIKLFDYGRDSSKAPVFRRLFSFLRRLAK